MSTAWLFAGGAAAVGLVASAWRYLNSLYQYMLGHKNGPRSADLFLSNCL
jgi:hypothetical protein